MSERDTQPQVKLDHDGKIGLFSHLLCQYRAGRVMAGRIKAAAPLLGVSSTTVARWLKTGQMPKRRRRTVGLSEAELEIYFRFHGSVAAACRELRSLGRLRYTERHYRRLFRVELKPHERAFAKEGEAGRRKFRVSRQFSATYANARWQADHKKLDVLVMVPREKKPQHPWVTIFMDDYSRYIEGFAISVYPTSGAVWNALYAAIVQGPPDSPGGGVPDCFLWDGGKEFLATAIGEAVINLGSQAIVTPPYTPQHKGKIERLNRTIIQEFLITLPFATQGPRQADGTLYGPALPPMSLDLFVAEFERWVQEYNFERPHSALGGRTPAQVLEDDPTERRRVPAEQLRWLLLERFQRKVQTRGVFVDGRYYIAPELNDLVGQTVDVARAPHDQRVVEVFYDGEHVCTAKPQEVLTKAEVERLSIRRKEDEKRASRLRRAASRKQRIRLLPMTAAGPIEDATVVTREEANSESATRSLAPLPPADASLLRLEGELFAPIDDGEAS